MDNLIAGIHHITALASDPQKNLDFYGGVLALRLVKKTVNFDAPDVYHLYYGDAIGSPGTILTFFPFPGLVKGQIGKGQVAVVSFAAARSAKDYWIKRLDKFQVPCQEVSKEFDKDVIQFEDPDGLALELVFNDADRRGGLIKGFYFYGITLLEDPHKKTSRLLTEKMNYQLIGEKDGCFRYSSTGKAGDFVDLLPSQGASYGVGGAGTVHHVAFATMNDETQVQAREKLLEAGLHVTPVLDRQYFHSVYFREPGGVLFEIATIPPGFTVDEPFEHLGEALKLPPWEEKNRELIEKKLVKIQLNKKRYQD